MTQTTMTDDLRGKNLSPAEVRVLELIALGHIRAEVGQILHISQTTVDSHMARISRKTGAGEASEIVAYHLRRGTIQPALVVPSREPRLTPRRRQLMELVAEGLDNIQIGQKVYLTHDSVKTTLQHTFRTLGARNRVHATALAIRMRLID